MVYALDVVYGCPREFYFVEGAEKGIVYDSKELAQYWVDYYRDELDVTCVIVEREKA